jgi:hypothetical protein
MTSPYNSSNAFLVSCKSMLLLPTDFYVAEIVELRASLLSCAASILRLVIGLVGLAWWSQKLYTMHRLHALRVCVSRRTGGYLVRRRQVVPSKNKLEVIVLSFK